MNNSETESWSNYLNVLLCTIEIQIWWCLCGFKTTASFTTYLTSWTQNKALIKEKRILSDFWCFLYHVPGKSSEFSSSWKSLFFWLPQTLVCLRPLDGVRVEGIEVGCGGLKGTRSPQKSVLVVKASGPQSAGLGTATGFGSLFIFLPTIQAIQTPKGAQVPEVPSVLFNWCSCMHTLAEL